MLFWSCSIPSDYRTPSHQTTLVCATSIHPKRSTIKTRHSFNGLPQSLFRILDITLMISKQSFMLSRFSLTNSHHQYSLLVPYSSTSQRAPLLPVFLRRARPLLSIKCLWNKHTAWIPAGCVCASGDNIAVWLILLFVASILFYTVRFMST